MTSAPQNPSLTRNPGSAAPGSKAPPSGPAGSNLHSTAGEGVPGDRMRQADAGDKLANLHAAQSGSEALAISTASAVPSLGATFTPC